MGLKLRYRGENGEIVEANSYCKNVNIVYGVGEKCLGDGCSRNGGG